MVDMFIEKNYKPMEGYKEKYIKVYMYGNGCTTW
jgi:hypothetical protein